MRRADAPVGRALAAALTVLALALAACSAAPEDDPQAAGPARDALQVAPEAFVPEVDPDDAEVVVPDLTGFVAPLAVSAPSDPPPVPASRDALERLAASLLDGAIDAAEGGSFHLLVVDEHGREVVSHDPDAVVLPASTLKIVTAAAALGTFGPDAVFRTRVEATAPIDGDGHLRGTLHLIGSGDPVLATEEYARWVYPARPRTPLEELADQLVDRGLEVLDGDLVGVADRFSGPLVAEGWPERYFSSLDARYSDGLTVDAGLRTILTYPEPDEDAEDDGDNGDDGEAADSDADDGADEDAGGDDPPPGVDPIVRVDHAREPAAHAAAELRRLLEDRGVEVRGEARAGMIEGTSVGRLASVDSPPMEELLRFAVQRSDNQITDAVFRAVGRARTGEGSFASGERALKQFLDRLGVEHDGAVFADGSGLSRDDRLTVRMLVDLDRAMLDTRYGPTWVSSMAVTGESGTLASRLAGTVADGRFAGKTGTLRDVSSLVGSVRAPDGRRYHLGVISNDAGAGRWISRALIDELILATVADLDGCTVRDAGESPGTLGRPPLAVAC
ncbi:MAG: D-alanyl-D-alanine carboxypeptidase/D-alanyl-D-alanine-endopeptidase [Nitriliruptoraceae bacterium]|nr:D-alanyl-D-alanine carboxypeptidase/D-alanyl-D-alanine-endopeptidase [Nitriliruptoraceae bacterium]